MRRNRRKSALGWLPVGTLLVALSPLAACSEDEATQDDSDGGEPSAEGGSAEGGAPGDGGPETAEPLFAVPTEIYGPDFATSTSYVPLVPSLDVDTIPLDDAREFTGRASVAAVGEYVFIASSSEPVVSRYTLAKDGTLKEAGRLNFMHYGVPEFFSIDPWGAVFIDEEKAYIFNGNDGSHVIWNPSTLEITGEIEGPDIVQEGYTMQSVAVVRGDRMYRIFSFVNRESWDWPAEPQYLAVYDVEEDELVELEEETRCPQIYSRPFVDEEGDIYFSGWVWTPGLALTGDYPPSCALRVRQGEDTFDPDWKLDFGEITEGREAGILRPLGDGKALLDVFYDERAEIDEDTDARDLSLTPNWRLWMVDLEEKTGEPVEGLDFRAGGYQDVHVDGRTFLMVPNDDYSQTTAHEIVDGEAVERFEVEGSSYHMVQVR